MKLGENRLKKRPLRSRELVASPEENEFKFDPKMELTEEDWANAENDLIAMCEGQKARPTCVKLLLAMQYLDQARYERLINSPRFKPLFDTLGRNSNAQLTPPHAGPDYTKDILAQLDIQNVFPHKEKVELVEAREPLKAEFETRFQLADMLESVYAFRRLQDTEMIQVTLMPEQINQFKQKWNAVWEEGPLEDVQPDNTVKMLAMIRVVDPKIFQTVKLDTQFWTKAIDWLRSLRESIDGVDDLFQFALNLYILAAEDVRVLPDGRLDIQPKKVMLDRKNPLPERETI